MAVALGDVRDDERRDEQEDVKHLSRKERHLWQQWKRQRGALPEMQWHFQIQEGHEKEKAMLGNSGDTGIVQNEGSSGEHCLGKRKDREEEVEKDETQSVRQIDAKVALGANTTTTTATTSYHSQGKAASSMTDLQQQALAVMYRFPNEVTNKVHALDVAAFHQNFPPLRPLLGALTKILHSQSRRKERTVVGAATANSTVTKEQKAVESHSTQKAIMAIERQVKWIMDDANSTVYAIQEQVSLMRGRLAAVNEDGDKDDEDDGHCYNGEGGMVEKDDDESRSLNIQENITAVNENGAPKVTKTNSDGHLQRCGGQQISLGRIEILTSPNESADEERAGAIGNSEGLSPGQETVISRSLHVANWQNEVERDDVVVVQDDGSNPNYSNTVEQQEGDLTLANCSDEPLILEQRSGLECLIQGEAHQVQETSRQEGRKAREEEKRRDEPRLFIPRISEPVADIKAKQAVVGGKTTTEVPSDRSMYPQTRSTGVLHQQYTADAGEYQTGQHITQGCPGRDGIPTLTRAASVEEGEVDNESPGQVQRFHSSRSRSSVSQEHSRLSSKDGSTEPLMRMGRLRTETTLDRHYIAASPASDPVGRSKRESHPLPSTHNGRSTPFWYGSIREADRQTPAYEY